MKMIVTLNGRQRRKFEAACSMMAAAGFAAASVVSSPAAAYDLPNLNLGFTSFLDGALPSGPGLYGMQYFQSYSANRLTDGQGNRLGLPKEDSSVQIGITQFVYLSSTKMGSGAFGLDVVVPYVLSSDANDGLGGAVLSANKGIGDVLVGPFYQFDPIQIPNGPPLLARIEAQVIAPTGDYDRAAAINPGSNFWSIDPYISLTTFLSPDWSASVRLHYLWNGKNDDPSLSFGPGAATSRAGQAVHANFATEYKMTPQLRLGMNGYWLQQTTDLEVNDTSVGGTREAVWALGPGGVYTFDKNNFLFVNAYREFEARNRAEGAKINIMFVHHFD
jgi:hypothetical protein